MKINSVDGLPFVVRHIRNFQDFNWENSEEGIEYDPFGGVSFGFLIDNENKQLRFVISVCRDNERFVRKIAFDVLVGRMQKGPDHYYVMDNYNREFSLVENAVSALGKMFDEDFTDGDSIWPFMNTEAVLTQVPKNHTSTVRAIAKKAIVAVTDNYEGSFTKYQ